MDQDTKPEPGDRARADQLGAADQSVDEFFTRLQSDMRRPDLSQEAITAAFQAIQKLALDSDAEEAADTAAVEGRICQACNAANPEASRFCAVCGVPLQAASQEAAGNVGAAVPQAPGQHHYHHHYHHHYFSTPNGVPQAPAQDFRPAGTASPVRDTGKGRAPSGGPAPALSRMETAVRKMTQDWALACNTKHLEDLVELYAADAVVLRPNVPPVRGTAAIREFFFAALDAGLGEAEFDPLRVELFGDFAYEAGRCKTLVPTLVGKRREERGKYLMLFVRQSGGDWKIVADSWSSDLSLTPGSEVGASNVANSGGSAPRPPRRGF